MKPVPIPPRPVVKLPTAGVRAVWVSDTTKLDWDTATRDFEERCRSVLKFAPRDRVVMGLAEWKFQRPDALNRQMEVCRQLGLAGFAWFSYDDAATRHYLPAAELR